MPSSPSNLTRVETVTSAHKYRLLTPPKSSTNKKNTKPVQKSSPGTILLHFSHFPMNARAYLFSFSPDFHSLHSHKASSDFPLPKKRLFRFRFQDRTCVFRVSGRNAGEFTGLARREIGKVFAEVKSEQVKFREALDDVVLGEEDLEGDVPWWEQFPKRWVIVILCFSAFLLCNMDRVSL